MTNAKQPFEQRFVNLARVARLAVRSGKDHRPRNVSRATPEFGADEIGDTAEEDANRRDERT